MKRRKLLWQIYPSYLVIIVLSLLVLSWYSSSFLRDFYLDRTAEDLQARAELASKSITAYLQSGDGSRIDALCKELGSETGTRITVILPSGRVLGDTDEDPAKMENHADRPEMAQALKGQVGRSSRFSYTVKKNMMYVAVPIRTEQKIEGVIRTSVPVSSINKALNIVTLVIARDGVFVALIAAVVSFFVSQKISKPLGELRSAAENFAGGDFSHKLPATGIEEMDEVVETMNRMAEETQWRINLITEQCCEREAILSSMSEGVVAIDTRESITSVNDAAAALLGVGKKQAQGRTIHEIARNAELSELVRTALSDGGVVEGQIMLLGGGVERFLQVRGAQLNNAKGEKSGVVLVLNDITRLRRLESIRKDFVANVSHELKTPITSIKGFVETLIDGAVKQPDDAQRFLGIIAKHADRLDTIVNDLLTLSRIEQQSETAQLNLSAAAVKDILNSAVVLCQRQLKEKDMKVEIQCDENITIMADSALLEQAVVNLIDNAAKYSKAKTTVRIEGTEDSRGVSISVSDQGCGIEAQYLPRLFERFYRVDKARSREMGGTGLGLAIVKHIVHAHGGTVSVVSTPGKGSTFTIHLSTTTPH